MSHAVNPAERDLLETIGRLSDLSEKREGSSGSGPVRLESAGEVATLRPIAEELVERGWLCKSDASDAYSRTEDGRLALAGPLDVTLYTRPGCHLCEEAKAQIAPLLRRTGALLREVNIDADPLLRGRYDFDVPVILLGTRKVAKHRVDLRQFERQLAEAVRGSRKD